VANRIEDPRPKLVVGIGASAGGLEALSSFFDHVPAESGLAFVVVTHQAPTALSLLPELLSRHAMIPVQEVVITFDDISKVKALQYESERMLGALQESPTSVFAQDRELRYVWASGRLFGREPADVNGKLDEQLVAGSGAARLSQIKRRVLQSGETARQRIELTLPSGTHDYDLYVSVQRDLDGSVLGITGVITQLAGEAS
jgi:PAS domain-containing protein